MDLSSLCEKHRSSRKSSSISLDIGHPVLGSPHPSSWLALLGHALNVQAGWVMEQSEATVSLG